MTSSTILLGGTGPLSGPEVAYAGVLIGAQAYFAHVNAQGGVHGRKIEYRYIDDGYDPSRTVQAVRRLVQQDRAFAIFNVVGTEQNLAVRSFLNASKVPLLFGGTGVRTMGREYRRYPWAMGYLPSFFAEGRLYGRHLVGTQERKGRGPVRGERLRARPARGPPRRNRPEGDDRRSADLRGDRHRPVRRSHSFDALARTF